MIEWVLIILLVIVLIYLSWRYAELKGEIENRGREIFERWRSTELETQAQEKADLLFRDWVQQEEKKIREDAIMRSEAVITGKVTEHLIPFFPNFKYNPKDARFIGTPVDLVVFNGLSEGHVGSIAFIEVKTGKTASLSNRERQVRNCVQSKNVTWELIHHENGEE